MTFSKKLIGILAVFMLLFLITDAQAGDRKVNWDAFSINLIKAIKSDHPGLQQSAMQRIIHYSDSLNVEEAVYDIALIFRFDDNPQRRRMAMVTLSSINTRYSMSYVCKYMKYEENPSIQKQCCCALQGYYAANEPENMHELIALLKEIQ